MYSTLESNLVSPYTTFLPFVFLSVCIAFSSASESAVYTDTNLLSKQWRIPLLHVDSELLFGNDSGLFACDTRTARHFFFAPALLQHEANSRTQISVRKESVHCQNRTTSSSVGMCVW